MKLKINTQCVVSNSNWTVEYMHGERARKWVIILVTFFIGWLTADLHNACTAPVGDNCDIRIAVISRTSLNLHILCKLLLSTLCHQTNNAWYSWSICIRIVIWAFFMNNSETNRDNWIILLDINLLLNSACIRVIFV